MATALETYFYHNCIKTYTSAFGTLFNQLKITRSADGKIIKVPLAYASRQKFDIIQKYEDTDAHRRITWPRMAFNMTGLQRDESRVENRRLTMRGVDDESGSLATQLNRVPYIFNYQLYIQAKNLDDLLQIVEQICAWFNPSLEIVITDNPDLSQNTAINIKLNTNSLQDSFEGLMEDEKNLSFTFDFDVEGYIYMPTETAKRIEKICLNYYDLDTELKFDESECFPEAEPVVATCDDDISPQCPVVSQFYENGTQRFDEFFDDARPTLGGLPF
jgi:hypothetical protein